jgi:alanyl-tRNA synthetase
VNKSFENINGVEFAVVETSVGNPGIIKDVSWQIKGEHPSVLLVIIAKAGEKILINVLLSDDLIKKGMNAVKTLKDLASVVKGGGGGQPFYATAGGSDLAKYSELISKAKDLKGLL